MNPLAGLALLYLIGADGPIEGKEGALVEVPYDQGLPKQGIGIGYCNLLDEENVGRFPPYRKPTDTAAQYNEGVPDEAGPGFEKNLRTQFERRRSQGFKYIELDNPDAYPLEAVMRATAWAEEYGLGVIAKNAALVDGGVQWLAHPRVVGVIVEKDAGGASQMHAMRIAAEKPDLPVWFVSFGSGRAWARLVAADILARDLRGMGVTWSSQGEYERSMDIFMPQKKLPSVFAPQQTQSSTDQTPPWLATMRSIKGTDEFAGGADNPIILSWRDFISRTYPEMEEYCRNYTHDSVPWCGLTVAYVMAVNGIRPVFGRSDTDKFLWADAWRQFGTKLERPQLGCVMVFTRDGGGHVSLYEDEDADRYKICGGNQSDSVNSTWMSKSKFSGAFWPNQVSAQVSRPAPAATSGRFTGITATNFHDAQVAYSDVAAGWNDRPGVSLPYRFKGPRPKVRVWRGGRSVDCEIMDVGPWYDNRSGWPFDPYWETGTRPRAETDDRTNRAGIDLTFPADAAIGLNGKGLVDWEFITENTMADPEVLPPANDALKKIWDQLAPQLMQIVAPYLENAIQALIQKALQDATAKLPLLLPPPVDTTQATTVPAQTATVGSAIGVIARAAGSILPMLGLQGSIWGTAALWVAQAADVIGTAAGPTATTSGGAATAALVGTGVSSLVSLLGRFFSKKS